MNLSSKGHQQKTVGGIRNNPASQKPQNADQPTPTPGTRPLPPKPEQRGRQAAVSTDDAKRLYPPAPQQTATPAEPGNTAPLTPKTRSSVSRSRTGSESPSKLVQRKRSTDLPRVTRVQKKLVDELDVSHEIRKTSERVLPEVSGPAKGLRLDLTAVKQQTSLHRETLSEATQPPATDRARSSEQGKAGQSQKTRSASPKKLPRSSIPQQPGSGSPKKKGGLLSRLRAPTSHRKGSKAGRSEKPLKAEHSPEAQIDSPPSPVFSPDQQLAGNSAPNLGHWVATTRREQTPASPSQTSPSGNKQWPPGSQRNDPMPAYPRLVDQQERELSPPRKPLPKAPKKQEPTRAEDATVERGPIHTEPEPQAHTADTGKGNLPQASTQSPREKTTAPVQTNAQQTEQEHASTKAQQRKTPREPGSPLAPMLRKPLLKVPKTTATPTTASSTDTAAEEVPEPEHKGDI